MMPDIALCQNDSCPIGHLCYRYMAVPDEDRQGYSDFRYVKDDGCEFFIRIEEDK